MIVKHKRHWEQMFVEINRAKPLLRFMLLLSLIDDLFEIRYLSVVGCLSLKATSTSWFHLSVSTTSINWFTFNTPTALSYPFVRERFFSANINNNIFWSQGKKMPKKWKRKRRKLEEGENPCKVLSCISLSIKMKMTTRWNEKNEKIDLCEKFGYILLAIIIPLLNPPPHSFIAEIHLTTYPPRL